jgi:hypothetical protein
MVVPWQVRNLGVVQPAGEPNLVSNFLVHGSYPDFMLDGKPETLGVPYQTDPRFARLGGRTSDAVALLVEKAKAAPVRTLRWYLLGKPYFFLSWTNIDGPGDIFVYSVERSPFFEVRTFDLVRQLMHALHWPLVLGGLLSCVLVLAPSNPLRLQPLQCHSAVLLATVVIYAIAFHMVGAPFPRYGVPFRPLLFALALVPIAALSGRWRYGRGSVAELLTPNVTK